VLTAKVPEVAPWQCPVCEILEQPYLRRLEKTWLDGKLTRDIRRAVSRKLARAHGDMTPTLALFSVDKHVDVCLRNRHRSRYARVGEQFNMLWEALHTAHKVYLNSPDMFNAQGYSNLVKQLRGLMADLDKVQNASELGEDLTRLAINPLIRALTNTLIAEAGRLKEDLTQYVDEDRVEKMVNGMVRRIATPFKRAAQSTHDQILDILSARDKNRASAVRGGPAKKRSTGKKTPLRVVK